MSSRLTTPLPRLAALVLAAAAATLAPLSAAAGVVAVLKSAPLAPYEACVRAFRAAYRGEILELSLQGEGPEAVARRIERAPVEAIVAVGLRATAFGRDRFPRLPLVFCAVQNPERHDLAGARITGVGSDVPERLELRALKDAAPDVATVGVLTGGDPAFGKAAREAAAAAGITLVERTVADRSGLAAAARELIARVDALWLPRDPAIASPETFQFLLELSLRERKPLLVFSEALVRAGAFLAVSPDYAWVGERAAEAVRRIQAGERAGDIPVAPLKRSRVVVNEATARALGRVLPAATLRDAEVMR